jgi:hypothetical protein
MGEKQCFCGSGLPRYELTDARGIFVSFICDDCEKKVKSKYRKDIFDDPDYWCDEQIEDDY